MNYDNDLISYRCSQILRIMREFDVGYAIVTVMKLCNAVIFAFVTQRHGINNTNTTIGKSHSCTNKKQTRSKHNVLCIPTIYEIVVGDNHDFFFNYFLYMYSLMSVWTLVPLL